MKSIALKLLLALACLTPAMALAQTADDEFFSDCPAFSIDDSVSLQWETMRAPGMLFCRAVRKDGSEAFALTFSRESPFSPKRVDRAEVGIFNDQRVQWYRASIVTARDAMVREALIDFGEGHVLHISMRANDAQTLARQQRDVLALPFPFKQQIAKRN